jgi:GAF domain-containing protein
MASIEDDVAAVLALPSTSRILSAVCALTGLRFAAIARVTDERWVSCATVDRLEFGLKPGDELVLETTLCHEVRGCGRTIVMDDASTDPVYRDHGTPKQYGFRSYISVPIVES